MKPVIIALTASGLETGRRAAAVVGADAHVRDADFSDNRLACPCTLHRRPPIVGVCAAGILIRILAPLLSDKRENRR